MRRNVLRASPVAVAITVLVAVISVVAFFLLRTSNDQQERALLQNDTGRAALVASSYLSEVGTALDSVANAVNLANASTESFLAQARSFAQGPISLALVHQAGDRFVVTAAAGTAFTPGQVLAGPAEATLGRTGPTFTPSPVVRTGRTSTAGFAVGPPLMPAGTALYMQFSLDPFTATPVTAGRLFSSLRAALYGSRRPDPSNLLVATTRALPLHGPVARAPVPVGAGTWTLVAEARTPLAGTLASDAPLVILLLGLVVALAGGATVEVLVRRHRYAAQLVAQRTSDLEDSMRDLRAAQDALVRSERLSALGEMASVVGHELRNPLTAVVNALFLIRRGLGEPVPDKLDGHLSMAERETDKAATLAEELTAFVRPRVPQPADVDLGELVEEVLQATPPPKGVAVSVDVDHVTIRADRKQMSEVLSNLLTNAYHAVPESGSVHVRGSATAAEATLVVEDDGPGIESGVTDQVFEPFFTTKAHGTGLGLAIVRRLAEAHGGSVAVENKPSGGACLTVRLPQAARLDAQDLARTSAPETQMRPHARVEHG